MSLEKNSGSALPHNTHITTHANTGKNSLCLSIIIWEKRGRITMLLKNTVESTFISISEPMKSPQDLNPAGFRELSLMQWRKRPNTTSQLKYMQRMPLCECMSVLSCTDQQKVLLKTTSEQSPKLFVPNNKQSEVLNVTFWETNFAFSTFF